MTFTYLFHIARKINQEAATKFCSQTKYQNTIPMSLVIQYNQTRLSHLRIDALVASITALQISHTLNFQENHRTAHTQLEPQKIPLIDSKLATTQIKYPISTNCQTPARGIFLKPFHTYTKLTGTDKKREPKVYSASVTQPWLASLTNLAYLNRVPLRAFNGGAT